MYFDILEYGIPTLIFVVVASGFYALMSRQMEDRRTRRRLRDELAESEDTVFQKEFLLGELTPAFAAQLPCPYEICETMDVAVKAANAQAQPGDVVLLAPAAASFDQYKSFEQRGEDFVAQVAAL